MKQPWIYMCSPSQSPLPLPSPPGPPRFSQCTRSKHLSHASNLFTPVCLSIVKISICQFYICYLHIHNVHAKLLQSYPTLCYPMNCSPPGSSVHGIVQVKILEWVAMTFSRGSSLSRDQTWISWISCIGRQVLYLYH